MARPESLTLDALARALTPAAQTPSELASKLRVSRATVHRRLLALSSEQLVVKTGKGPKVGYRLPTVSEALQRGRAQSSPPSLLRMELSLVQASCLRGALEFMARLGIGQFGQIEEACRMLCIGKSGQFPSEELDRIQSLCGSLQQTLLGMPMNASHGIYSPHVHPRMLQAWQISKILRHRIAWDNQPEGGIGVWHDEPDEKPSELHFSVYSEVRNDERVYLLEFQKDWLALLMKALSAEVHALNADLSFLLDWARAGVLRKREGDVATEADLAQAQVLLAALQPLIAGVKANQSKSCARSKTLLDSLTLYQEDPEAYAQVKTTDAPNIVRASSSPFALTIEDLPQGMMLNFQNGQYRIIAPSLTGDALVIIGKSHSIQTAVEMAKNYAKKGSTRGF